MERQRGSKPKDLLRKARTRCPRLVHPGFRLAISIARKALPAIVIGIPNHYQSGARPGSLGVRYSLRESGDYITLHYITHHTQRIALAASRYEACHIIHVTNQEKGCLARGERGRWVGQRAATTAGPPARTPAAEAGGGE